MKSSWRYFLPALAWGVVVFLIISLPPARMPSVEHIRIPHFDKVVHFSVFAILGFLLLFGFNKHKTTITKGIANSIAIGIFYGIITEVLQYCCFAGRHGNIFDAMANGFGTVFGVFLMAIIIKKNTYLFFDIWGK